MLLVVIILYGRRLSTRASTVIYSVRWEENGGTRCTFVVTLRIEEFPVYEALWARAWLREEARTSIDLSFAKHSVHIV